MLMQLPNVLSNKCKTFWDWLISPSFLFVSVIISFPAFLFQQNLFVQIGEVIVFFILALTKRGKIKVVASIFVLLGVTFFSLFSPYGEILYKIGSFTITKGALETGFHRGLLLVGMVFLSQLAVSPKIELPGKIGKFIATMFYYLDELGKEKIHFKKNNILTSIDDKLYATYYAKPLKEETCNKKLAIREKISFFRCKALFLVSYSQFYYIFC